MIVYKKGQGLFSLETQIIMPTIYQVEILVHIGIKWLNCELEALQHEEAWSCYKSESKLTRLKKGKNEQYRKLNRGHKSAKKN